MKFQCGSKEDKKWYKWFAWYPVSVGPNDCRWMETVERQGLYDDWGLICYTYRSVNCNCSTCGGN